MSNINPFSAKMSESQTQQQSLSLTMGGKSLDEVQAMKSTQNLTASHGVEELSDEQLETVAGGIVGIPRHMIGGSRWRWM
jgi:hypothetical protein